MNAHADRSPLHSGDQGNRAPRVQEAHLDANSLLADGLTYPGFKLDFQGTFTLPGRETLVWAEVQKGEKPAADDEKVPATFEYRSLNPNEARQSHDLPIPVEVKTPSGTERRKVKFAK